MANTLHVLGVTSGLNCAIAITSGSGWVGRNSLPDTSFFAARRSILSRRCQRQVRGQIRISDYRHKKGALCHDCQRSSAAASNAAAAKLIGCPPLISPASTRPGGGAEGPQSPAPASGSRAATLRSWLVSRSSPAISTPGGTRCKLAAAPQFQKRDSSLRRHGVRLTQRTHFERRTLGTDERSTPGRRDIQRPRESRHQSAAVPGHLARCVGRPG